jgi:hypothetical protein
MSIFAVKTPKKTKLPFNFLFIKKKIERIGKKGSQGGPTMGHLVIFL